MIRKRLAAERGTFDHGWLLARHSFSFASYQDPEHVSFRTLRVINEDTVQPGQGFATHGHEDMEILTYVLEGALEHRDSMGETGVLRPGDVQVMSAGTGVTHSEFNHSATDPLWLLQIWLLPDASGHDPSYADRTFSIDERHNVLRLLASGDDSADALHFHQDAQVFASVLDSGAELTHEVADGRGVWLQVARGAIEVDGERLAAGDGAAIEDVERVTIHGVEKSELILFDLA